MVYFTILTEDMTEFQFANLALVTENHSTTRFDGNNYTV